MGEQPFENLGELGCLVESSISVALSGTSLLFGRYYETNASRRNQVQRS
jgi:hypothetical protein